MKVKLAESWGSDQEKSVLELCKVVVGNELEAEEKGNRAVLVSTPQKDIPLLLFLQSSQNLSWLSFFSIFINLVLHSVSTQSKTKTTRKSNWFTRVQ